MYELIKNTYLEIVICMLVDLGYSASEFGIRRHNTYKLQWVIDNLCLCWAEGDQEKTIVRIVSKMAMGSQIGTM